MAAVTSAAEETQDQDALGVSVAPSVPPTKTRRDAAVQPNVMKELKIKINVVIRMDKEVKFYLKEAGENEALVQKMKDEGKDVYDMKQAQECLQESYMMIPDSKNRFQKALEDLLDFLGENAENETVAGTEQLVQAKELLSSHDMPFESPDSGDADGGEEFGDEEIF